MTRGGNEICCWDMNNTSIVKRGRGRPVGATSFVNVSVADLVQFFNDAPVPVSRIWLEKMNLTIQPIERTISEVNVQTVPVIEYKITKL